MLSKFTLNIFLTTSKRFSSAFAKLMEKGGIVPDILDCAPFKKATIVYSGELQVSVGNELTPSQVKYCPKVRYCNDPNCCYTLLMTNPDSPSRANPVYKEWYHWLVVNIPGDSVKDGETLYEYIGAIPPKGAGLQRYVFLIFQQPDRRSFNEQYLTNTSDCNRNKLSTRKFVSKYNLGVPLAGNYFQSQFDDYVPILTKQLICGR